MSWYLGLVAAPLAGCSTQFFLPTGADDAFVVPAGVTSVEAIAWGGGYWGGQTYATIPVTPGETLRVRVGLAATTRLGGWPNGGNGGLGVSGHYGRGGCGGSDVFRGVTPLLVAGGEGGGNDETLSNTGGTVGGLGAEGGVGAASSNTPIPGTPNGTTAGVGGNAGGGGTQVAGGVAGAGGTVPATPGALDQGGNGCNHATGGRVDAAGGGGGGYYGGGGGGFFVIFGLGGAWGGGGGSCYIDPTLTGVTYTDRYGLDLSAYLCDGSVCGGFPIVPIAYDPGGCLTSCVPGSVGADGFVAFRWNCPP